MSYLVLARKFRPKTFEEIVGQKAVVRTLQNALSQDRVSHALIFSGVRGVGKTTLARIMAKSLNCTNRQEAEPCNECSSCTEINTGSSIDLIEIDGASNRGIQEIRELKENIRFMPTGSQYKIIIIDEVHMLTTEAFNALLKTLEEPPEHVYFMFATTELHRVPITILSRCQRYELKRIDSRELKAYFQKIADREQVQVEAGALNIIVREARGSVRDGLSLLDQVFSYCNRSVTIEDVEEILGLASHRVVAEVADAILSGDVAAGLEIFDRTYSFGIDSKRFINDLLFRFRSLVICSISRNPEKFLDYPDEEITELIQCSRKYSTQTLILMLNVLMDNLEKAGYSSRPRLALEMALVKAAQARDVVPVTKILGRLDRIIGEDLTGLLQEVEEDGPTEKKTAVSGEAINNRKSDTVADDTVEPAVKAHLRDVESRDNNDDTSGVAEIASGHGATADEDDVPFSSDSAGIESAYGDRDTDNRVVRQQWNKFVDYVKDRKPWMASALQMAGSAHLVDGELVIEYESSINCRMLRYRENITLLTEFAMDFFQEDFRVRFSVPDSAACEVDPANGNKVKEERHALANDSLVLTAVDIFNGEVGDIRVGPRFRSPILEKKQQKDEESTDNC